MSVSQLGIAMPNFWFAILLIWLFAVKLRWFSAGGFPGWSADDGGGVGPGLRALVLPAIALAVVQAAILARIVRSAVLDVLREDFVRTARAKGQSPRGVLWGHVLRNAMVPVLTVMGLQFANLLTGTVVIENVFSLPGLGRLVFQAIANRDLLVVRDVVMLLAAAVVVINFVVDVLYVVIDPRLRARRAHERGGRRPPVARRSRWRRANFAVGAVLVAAVVALALLSFVWTPYPATELDIPHKLQPPSGRALARHRQPRPRHRLAPDRRQPGLDRGRPDRGRHRHRLRRRPRPARRGAARLGRGGGDAASPTSPSPSRRCSRRSC